MPDGSEEKKEKWDESFSRTRATRKKEGQRAPPPSPTRFSRTGCSSVVVTALVSDLSTLRKRPRSAKLTRVLKELAYVATLHCTLVHYKWNNEKSQRCKKLKCLKYTFYQKLCPTNIVDLIEANSFASLRLFHISHILEKNWIFNSIF